MEVWLLVGGVGLLLFSLLMLVLGIALVVYSKKKKARLRPDSLAAAQPSPSLPPPTPPAVAPRTQPDVVPAQTLSAAPTLVTSWGSLTGTAGSAMGRTIPLDPNGFYIGRDGGASQVVVESPRVSKRHLWVGVQNGAVVAVDQKSTNGTYLNSVNSPRITEVVLQPGDTLILADDAARFEYQR